jgi:hypothetical protein
LERQSDQPRLIGAPDAPSRRLHAVTARGVVDNELTIWIETN